MSNIKFSPSLFLETIELQRFKESLDIESINSSTGLASNGGWRKNLLEETVSFGLVKNNRDISFKNGLVNADSDLIVGSQTFKTIKIQNLYAIDSFGQSIYQDPVQSKTIPSDSNWYWVRISHNYSSIEKGTFSLAIDGTLSGTGGEFTKILRGGLSNFASKIRFSNSTLNTLDYEVLQVIDDNNCILIGTSFQAETGLTLSNVGTFTPGVQPSSNDVLPFQYDSCFLELVQEVIINTPPSTGFTQDVTFYLARVNSDGTNLQVQDKRKDFWETKGSNLAISIDRIQNALIGVEAVKFSNPLDPGDKNNILVSWGLRCSSWNINTNTNTLTISGSVTGGIYRDINSITNNAFNEWRVYTSNGLYSRIISSVKTGSAFNLVLDTLDIDNYYTGGIGINGNIITQELLIVPDTEEVEILLSPDPSDNLSSEIVSYTFPVNTRIGTCPVLAYTPTSPNTYVLYNIKYRYKSFKEYTQYQVTPSSTTGYYTENSFDTSGNLIISPTLLPYTSDPINGFIQVNISPNAYLNFVKKVDKGDLIGVTDLTSLTVFTDLIVGTSLNFLNITGNITLLGNTVIRLSTVGAISGNEFRVHLNCTSFNFSNNTFTIQQGSGSLNTTIKNITLGDIYTMLNIDGGIIFDFVYDGTNWILSQNYELGVPFEIKILSRTTALTNFDTTTGLGKNKGFFGYSVADTRNGTDDLRSMFLVGQNQSDGDYSIIGNIGGGKKNTLLEENIPKHSLKYRVTQENISSAGSVQLNCLNSGGNGLWLTDNQYDTSTFGGDSITGLTTSIENRPPYYTVLYIQRTY